MKPTFPLDETYFDAVRRLIELRGFYPSASTSRARRKDAAGAVVHRCSGSLKACNFIKKRLQHRCFPVNIAKL